MWPFGRRRPDRPTDGPHEVHRAGCADWRSVAPIVPVQSSAFHTIDTDFERTLPTRAAPTFLAPLAHQVRADAPSGLVSGLAAADPPRDHLPARGASGAAADGARVQRSFASAPSSLGTPRIVASAGSNSPETQPAAADAALHPQSESVVALTPQRALVTAPAPQPPAVPRRLVAVSRTENGAPHAVSHGVTSAEADDARGLQSAAAVTPSEPPSSVEALLEGAGSGEDDIAETIEETSSDAPLLAQRDAGDRRSAPPRPTQTARGDEQTGRSSPIAPSASDEFGGADTRPATSPRTRPAVRIGPPLEGRPAVQRSPAAGEAPSADVDERPVAASVDPSPHVTPFGRDSSLPPIGARPVPESGNTSPQVQHAPVAATSPQIQRATATAPAFGPVKGNSPGSPPAVQRSGHDSSHPPIGARPVSSSETTSSQIDRPITVPPVAEAAAGQRRESPPTQQPGGEMPLSSIRARSAPDPGPAPAPIGDETELAPTLGGDLSIRASDGVDPTPSSAPAAVVARQLEETSRSESAAGTPAAARTADAGPLVGVRRLLADRPLARSVGIPSTNVGSPSGAREAHSPTASSMPSTIGAAQAVTVGRQVAAAGAGGDRRPVSVAATQRSPLSPSASSSGSVPAQMSFSAAASVDSEPRPATAPTGFVTLDDGSVVPLGFGAPSGSSAAPGVEAVQRQAAESSAESTGSSTAPTTVTATAPPASATPAGPPSEEQVQTLVRSLYPLLHRRLCRDLLLDRERTGYRTDIRF